AAGRDLAVADIAASFQDAVCDVVTAKAVDACQERGAETLVIAGGVAANGRLREFAQARADEAGLSLRVPSPGLCTDNGAMVAALGASVVGAGVGASSPHLGADSSLPVTRIVVN